MNIPVVSGLKGHDDAILGRASRDPISLLSVRWALLLVHRPRVAFHPFAHAGRSGSRVRIPPSPSTRAITPMRGVWPSRGRRWP